MANSDGKITVALIGGGFALLGIILTWYLNDPGGDASETNPSAAQLQIQEQIRRDNLVASCIQSAKGRFEAALLADALLIAVQNGTQSVSGNADANRRCKNSSFVRWENLDTNFTEQFYWIEPTELEGSKVICRCSN